MVYLGCLRPGLATVFRSVSSLRVLWKTQIRLLEFPTACVMFITVNRGKIFLEMIENLSKDSLMWTPETGCGLSHQSAALTSYIHHIYITGVDNCELSSIAHH